MTALQEVYYFAKANNISPKQINKLLNSMREELKGVAPIILEAGVKYKWVNRSIDDPWREESEAGN